ncbi:MAG TPA: peptidase C26 [Blastocatellia bacterium]|jgi:putative glutamine amidotransferase|nr:peptidase C26 [Blastocatellia bacterium]HAF22594.1 peptidase C26 [Blastocatellia bacterium]HCX30564.1 peptidase C26 [Blastocatellia bacterium]
MNYDSYADDTKPQLARPARPRIGITTRLELESDRFYLSRHYSEAVEAAGGVPLHISLIPRRDYISAVMDGLDGVLLPGSDSDVDPARYGAEPHPNLGTVVPVKDETDFLVLEEVEKRALPLFAICFGMQVLNVFRGGTLIQDIASQTSNAIKHEQGAPRDRPSHNVRLAKESLLSSLAQDEKAFVNSHHHQAIDKVGRDLIATAWASDGLIEAIEDPRPDSFVVGVQWHPELGWQVDRLSQALFNHFIAATKEYVNRAGKTSVEMETESVAEGAPANA